jgi:hypothetical protein
MHVLNHLLRFVTVPSLSRATSFLNRRRDGRTECSNRFTAARASRVIDHEGFAPACVSTTMKPLVPALAGVRGPTAASVKASFPSLLS